MRLGFYELEDEIGAGGFGRVYRARHAELEVIRAVKVATDAEYARLLRKEGKMLARLQHPCIVQVFDMDTAHEPPYIVMEYLPGGDLRAKLGQGLLAVDDALRIMRDVLEALAHAHGKGIIHRDLKPSNILLDAEGRAKVADFGLGRIVEEVSMSAAHISALRSRSGVGEKSGSGIGDNAADSSAGTLKYMSPEQMDPSLLHGAALDGRSDLYSLGLVFYELLTGKLPAGLRPKMPSELRTDVSNEIDNILCKMLEAELSERYANATEVHDAVAASSRSARGGTVSAKKTASPPKDLPQSQINPIDGACMVWVSAGEFLMGSSDAQIEAIIGANPTFNKEWFGNEKPQHTVYLDGYWIYKNDVTVAQYRQFCALTGRQMPDAPSWGWIDDHPVVNVSWDDAKAYAKWAGAALPTEAQWEKAARGTDGRIYPWGNEWDAAKCNNSVGSNNSQKTSPVGSYSADVSPYGCTDMAGNVWQWCTDWYDKDYYQSSPARNPTGPGSGETRVVRGGSWYYYNAGGLRVSFRYGDEPADHYVNIGFRCVSRSPGP